MSEHERRDEPPPLDGAIGRWPDEGDRWMAIDAKGELFSWWPGNADVQVVGWIPYRRARDINDMDTRAVRILAAALAERDRELAEAVKVLRAVEWGSAPVVALSECPWCLSYKRDGHKPDCKLGRFLRARTASAQGGAKGGRE